MTPNPPTWIRTIITRCPKVVQWVAVSTTTNPVIQVAEVAVKSAVIKSTCPSRTAQGVERSRVPIRIRAAKLTTNNRGGLMPIMATTPSFAD